MKDIKRIVDDQIKNQTRVRLGNVDIPSVKTFLFKTEVDKDSLKPAVWTKRYYSFDRGESFGISDKLFKNYQSIKRIFLPASPSGILVDGGLEEFSNAMYSISVYSKNGVILVLPIECDNKTNLFARTYYSESVSDIEKTIISTEVITSSSIYFSSGTFSITIPAEKWTTIEITLYRKQSGGFIYALKNLLEFVDDWRYADTEPPEQPKWADPPIVTSSNPVSLITSNTLKWNMPESLDWAGHLIYSREPIYRGAIGEQVLPNQPMRINNDGNISDSGNKGFMLSNVDSIGFNTGSKIELKGRKYTVTGYEEVNGNLINNGDFSDYTGTKFKDWKMVSSPFVTNSIASSIAYDDNVVGGACINCTAKSTGSTKTVYLISSAYTPVDIKKDYSLSISSKLISNAVTAPYGFQFFSSSNGTLCSTPFLGRHMSTASGWIDYNLNLYHHTANTTVKIPNNCKYIKVKAYLTQNITGASNRRFDGVIFSEFNKNQIYLTQTSDGTFVKTKEMLTVPYNKYFTQHVPLNSDLTYVGIGTLTNTGKHKKRTNDVFNCFGGGYAFAKPILNYVKNGMFSSANSYWNQSHTGVLQISTSNVFNPPFGSSCAIINGKTSNNSVKRYITQTITGAPVSRGSYYISLYAKGDTCTSLYLGQQVATQISSVTVPITKEWKRYYLQTTANSFSASKAVYVGIPANKSGSLKVSGIQLEYSSTVTAFYPKPFNDAYTNGTTRGFGTKTSFTTYPSGNLLNTTQGTLRIFYTPDYDYNKADSRKYILSAGVVPVSGMSTNRIDCYYNPGSQKFIFSAVRSGVESSAKSTAQSFMAGDRLCIHLLWDKSRKRIDVDGYMSTSAAKGFPTRVDYMTLGTYYSTAETTNDFGMPADGVLTELIISENKFNSKSVIIDSQATGIAPPTDLNQPASDNIVGYQYELIGDRKRTMEDVIKLVDGIFVATPLTFTHTPVIPNRLYTYAISAYDYDLNPSIYSEEQSIIAGDKIPPAPITSTSKSNGYGSITYKWVNPTDSDFKQNKIYKTNVYTSGNVIDNVIGEPGLANSWTQNTSAGFHKVYITTLDHNGNENLNGVGIGGTALGIDSINTSIYVEWQTNAPEGYVFQSNATKYFNIIITSQVQLTFPNSNYGVAIYGADNTKLYGTSSGFSVPGGTYRGETWQYQILGASITFGSGSEGYGAIKFKGLVSGLDVQQELTVNFDRTAPAAPTIALRNVTGGPAVYQGKTQALTARFTGLSSDVYKCQLSTTASYSDTAWTTDFINCPLILPDIAKTYTIRGFVVDKALNVSPASGSVTYAYTGVGIVPSITIKSPTGVLLTPNEDGWYNSYLIAELKGETTAPNAITSLSYNVKRVKPTGLADINGSFTGSGATLTTNISFGGATADAVNEITLTATDRSGNKAVAKLTVAQDDTKPVAMASIWDSTVTGFRNNATYLKWKQGSTDNLSGIKQYDVWRSQSGVTNSNRKIGTVSSAVFWFDDTEDVLEGYVTYNYSLQVRDFAGNTVTGVAKSINLVAPWDRTFRNWIDNGSGDRDNNQSWTFQNGAVISSGAKLSGAKSFYLPNTGGYPFGGGSVLLQQVMLPELSGTFIKTDDRYVISFYCYPNNINQTLQLYYYDYAGSPIVLNSGSSYDQWSTFTDAGNTNDVSGNSWKRKYLVLNPNGWIADATKRGQSVYVFVVLGQPSGGACYIDNIQWEDRKSTDTTPTKFIDNHTLTADRFHVGFIRASMIKVNDLHAGLFHANGIEISNILTGAPYLQIGQYDANESFVRFSQYGGYRHFVGQSLGNGFSLIDHVESGVSNITTGGQFSGTFRYEYKDWDGNSINPKVLFEFPVMFSYNPTYSASQQHIYVKKGISSTGFTGQIFTIMNTLSGKLGTNLTASLSPSTNYDINPIVAGAFHCRLSLFFKWRVNWTATETTTQRITVSFYGFEDTNNDGVGDSWILLGTRSVSSKQIESIDYDWEYNNVLDKRFIGVRFNYVVNEGSGMTITNAPGYAYACSFASVDNPPMVSVAVPNSSPIRWTSFHNLM